MRSDWPTSLAIGCKVCRTAWCGLMLKPYSETHSNFTTPSPFSDYPPRSGVLAPYSLSFLARLYLDIELNRKVLGVDL